MAAPVATVIVMNANAPSGARSRARDVIVLATGDKVPADARLTEAVNLPRIEAGTALTRIRSREKHNHTACGREPSHRDSRNMAFAGTCCYLRARRALIVATGMATEFGKIARMLEEVANREDGRYRRTSIESASRMARAAFAVVAVSVVLGLFRGQPFVEI